MILNKFTIIQTALYTDTKQLQSTQIISCNQTDCDWIIKVEFDNHYIPS